MNSEIKLKFPNPFIQRLKVVSVPKSFPTENKNDVISNMIASNSFLQEPFNENNDCLQFLFSYDINGNQSLIFKCSPEIRKKLKDQGDVIKIGYNECKLYTQVLTTAQLLFCTTFPKFSNVFYYLE